MQQKSEFSSLVFISVLILSTFACTPSSNIDSYTNKDNSPDISSYIPENIEYCNSLHTFYIERGLPSEINVVYGILDSKLYVAIFDIDYNFIREFKSSFSEDIEGYLGYGQSYILENIHLWGIHVYNDSLYITLLFKYKGKSTLFKTLFINNNETIVIDSVDSNTDITEYSYYTHLTYVPFNDECVFVFLHYNVNYSLPPLPNDLCCRFYCISTSGNILYCLDENGDHRNHNLLEISRYLRNNMDFIISYDKYLRIRNSQISCVDLQYSTNIWSYTISRDTDLPSDAKYNNIKLLNKNQNIWKFEVEWMCYDASILTSIFSIDITDGKVVN